MVTKLRITDRKLNVEDRSIFASNQPDDGAVFGVVKTQNGLVALIHRYEPLGYLVDTFGKLWEELQEHPAYQGQIYADREFDYGRVKGGVFFLDLDRLRSN